VDKPRKLSSTGGGKEKMASDSGNLQISAIVCTYSNAALLRRTLDTLINQTLPPQEYEIVVVDNNSTDNTREVVREFEERASHQIHYMLETTQGLSAARNTGIQHSSGPIISFIDDDAEADPNWLSAVVEAFRQHPNAWGVGGNTFAIWDAERPAWLTDDFLPDLSIQDRGTENLKLPMQQHLLGTNSSFRREVFVKIGYFPTDLGRVGKSLLAGEEAELCRRIHLQGKSMYHIPEVVVYHHVTPERMNRSYLRKRCYLSGLSRAFYVSRTYGIDSARNELRGRWLMLAAKFFSDAIKCLTLKRPKHTLFRYWTWFLLELGYTRGLRQGLQTFSGMGGILFLAIIGLYIAGALVEPLRWYLIGTASGLLLLCGGVLVLLYARFILIRFIREQRKQVSDINKQISALNKEISDSKGTLAKMNVGNFAFFQLFNRQLTNKDLKHFVEEWTPKLGLKVDGRTLAYFAHRICLAEDICIGRLAGHIETMLLRVLVARSLRHEPNLEVLEIGTLFGIGVAMIHENCRGLFNNIHLTVIDPFTGHIGRHDKTSLDPLTKAPATREIFVHNMQRMNIPKSDYTIIEKLSTEDEAIEQASKRRYNLLIIDGDHSEFGVKHDFYNYRHLMKRGGYIIFDDYGNPNWPGLTHFVDKDVAMMPELEFVGTDVHIAVFRVITPQNLTRRGRKQHK
jgi:glycosyltransferase involved in cell wall biosynthesis